MDSSQGGEMKQSQEEDSPSQPHTPPSGSEKQPSETEVTPPQKLPVHRKQEPLTPGGETEAEYNAGGTWSKQRRCKCKASRCLKLYCECFASGSYCNGCNCLNCHNILVKETERREAIKAILERNPDAFKPKFSVNPHGFNDFQEDVSQLVKHNKGCQCKTGCLKKYCPCNQANVRCAEKCRCQDCKNFEGSQEINIKAVSGSTTSTYRSSLSDTTQLHHVKALCSLLVSKSMEVANEMSDTRRKNEKDSSLDPAERDASVINDSPDGVLDTGGTEERPMSPSTRALMCDDEHVTISEKETTSQLRTSQEKEEDRDTTSEVYVEQEKHILSCFRDQLIQVFNHGSINGRNIQKANTDQSRKEPEDEEESH